MGDDAQSVAALPPPLSRRQARAHRILDAAAALVLRWGYDKTTIDDICRQAGVAKGTIYLHWKTREELFATLIRRENAQWLDDFAHHLANDPEGATLRSLLKHSAFGLNRRPLLKALVLGDKDVIGKLARSESSSVSTLEKLEGFRAYLEFLRQRGLVRTDLSLRQELHVLAAIFFGFFLVSPLMPKELAVSEEEAAELMAETADRTLSAGRAVSPEEAKAIAEAFRQYLNRYRSAVLEQHRQEIDRGG